ncbi:hypothetical protein NLG97_g7839 [Lecanicillium saksenae]|uniref:Uncharacterized protein n=1 Tax=Lecanicillium saksenae TaxID=468837 RepID=A0ACC1QNL7_9HYPO|nr:hypothetical protein NLG97_g7839 [Lecanicillium saksenae]
MDEIKVPERLNRIARDLSRLPPELREPILSQLNFADIVRLAVAPAASSSLNESIRYSDEWKWLFEDKLESIKASWVALDEICWLWCHRTWLALWRARNLIRKGTKSIFSFSSKELNDGGYRYWNEEPSWDPEDRSGPDNADRPDTIDADLRGLALTLFSVFIGANNDIVNRSYYHYLNLKYRESFNLTLWKRHRSLGVLERRAISLFLPGAVRDALLSGDPLPREFESHQTWEQFMANAPTEEALTLCAGALASRVWTYEEIFQVLPILHKALSMLNQAQSEELNSLANLYERYPKLLKEPQAPNSPRHTTQHILNQLRQDAEQARKRPAFISRKTLAEPNPNRASGSVMLANYRFRHLHLPLIPYNWCIHLFHAIINRYPIKGAKEALIYPLELLPKLELAVAGFHNVHTHGETPESPRTRRISTATPDDPYYLLQLSTMDGCPKSLAEIRWLVAFTECVDWMSRHFEKDLAYAQRVCFNVEPAAQVIKYKNAVLSWGDYEQLVQTVSPRDIARHLLLDSEVCDNIGKRYDGVLPSLLALHVPAFESELGRAIGHHLVQGKGKIGHDATRVYYESVVEKISYHIQYPKLGEPTASIYRRWIPKRPATEAGPSQHIQSDTEHEASAERNEDTLQAALRIAQQLKALDLGEADTHTAATAMSALEKLIDVQSRHETKAKVQSQSWDDVEKAYHDSLCVEAAQKPAQRAIIRCYICRFTCTQQHTVFPSMCVPCGDFNIAGSKFTKNPSILPPDDYKVALITGGRVNLGFHLALHFLEQGFRVIITTRYPQDARDRYKRFFSNKGREHARNHLRRLQIIGADFRTSVDVFATVQSIKAILDRWSDWYNRPIRLYFLINNAAQTLTDSIAKETVAMEKEALLAEQGYDGEDLRNIASDRGQRATKACLKHRGI